MLKKLWNFIIYSDRSQELSDNIEFLKGLHRALEVKNEDMD